jgi:hypothetical protein
MSDHTVTDITEPLSVTELLSHEYKRGHAQGTREADDIARAERNLTMTAVQAFINILAEEVDSDHEAWGHLEALFAGHLLDDPRFTEEELRFQVVTTSEVVVTVKYRNGDRDAIVENVIDKLGDADHGDEVDDEETYEVTDTSWSTPDVEVEEHRRTFW